MNKSNHISKISTLYNLIDTITKPHEKTTAIWHDDQPKEPNITDTFMKNVILNHLMNFKLWHIEDIARRRNVDHEIIANCKHEIDLLNQKRTDYYEQLDINFICLLKQVTYIAKNAQKNTESIGMIIDRLSILALKIYHMTKELNRRSTTDIDYSLIRDKVITLNHQKQDLVSAVKYLISEYVDGKKSPMTYKQFKMYNYPTLNPELYKL